MKKLLWLCVCGAGLLISVVGIIPPGTDVATAAANHAPHFYVDEAGLLLGVRAGVPDSGLPGTKTRESAPLRREGCALLFVSSQLFQYRFRLSQIFGIDPFGEPAVDF